MSRIFDALQRAERERPGGDSTSLPEGQDLIRNAERRAATEWNGTAETSLTSLLEHDGISQLYAEDRTLSNSETDLDAFTFKKELGAEREKVFSSFQPQPIFLSEQSRLVCLTDKESPTAEAIRLLAVRLRDIRRSKLLKKVLITSTIPSEGKSTISGNLACVLANSNDQKVLLLEGDLRRPALSRMFGIRPDDGIGECLRGESISLKGIHYLKDANLWFLPAGSAPKNPLELLQSPKLSL